MKNILFFSLLFCLASLQAQTLHQINTVGSTFVPSNLTIEPGDMVQWTNGGGNHNVAADDDSFRCANGCDGMGGNGNPASNAWTFTLTFNTPGDIDFHCEIHGSHGGGGMSGTISVVPVAPPGCTSLTSPANGATAVPVTSALTWAAATGATGYRLDVGTTSGGTDILNNFDAGNVTTYNPPGDFPYNITIYVTLTPYNGLGDASNCTEESFSTPVCIPNLTLENLTIPSGTYWSDGELTANMATIANGSTVVFKSDASILLMQNFTVELNAVLDALIEACPD